MAKYLDLKYFFDGLEEWLGCVMCGRAMHGGCDGACDMEARKYAKEASDALEFWVQDSPAIETPDVIFCKDCEYNNACLTQSFVRDEGLKTFDPDKWFCADGRKTEAKDE